PGHFNLSPKPRLSQGGAFLLLRGILLELFLSSNRRHPRRQWWAVWAHPDLIDELSLACPGARLFLGRSWCWGFSAQIAHEQVEALLISIVLRPADEVSYVPGSHFGSPSFLGVLHRVVYFHWKENNLPASALFFESCCNLILDPVARDRTPGQDQQNLVS